MNLYLFFPIVFAGFVFITILICNYRTFKIEDYMQSKIKESTVLDIFNMTSIERKLGLIQEPLPSRKKKNLNVFIEAGNGLIQFFRTNQNDREWEEICARNFKQAIDMGFSKKLFMTCVHKTNLESLEKTYEHWHDSYILSVNFNNKEITLTNPGGWKLISPEYNSIMPLIENFRKFKSQFKK